ncbi:hypothetical protein [Ensifer sp. SSB1]|jgi:hypothetical protein|uniref:hypothetical protein n=1 Tax=Ensifer sp. SSB1 TaxID=2795385 RepID=UPI001A37B6E7|nr:hypothetical protein [Ensifer sp. SSB1]MBK5566900.1 hypothetical protein [Ensifer sp. SSB1]
MSAVVVIKPDQWVLAFNQPYGPYFEPMPQHLENFARRGGGWDNCRPSEIFLVHQIDRVMPKTYTSAGNDSRLDRVTVIAAGPSKESMIALRDRLFAVGVETDDAIEAEMYRRIERFAAKKRAAAERKIHRLLPHHFKTPRAEGGAA